MGLPMYTTQEKSFSLREQSHTKAMREKNQRLITRNRTAYFFLLKQNNAVS